MQLGKGVVIYRVRYGREVARVRERGYINENKGQPVLCVARVEVTK